jgi:hypothetical protein
MGIRLGELRVASEIHVIHPPFPGAEGQAPAGVLTCEVLHVTFVFDTTRHNVQGRNVPIIAADMLATQQASERSDDGTIKCLDDARRRQWALQAGPRTLPGPVALDDGHELAPNRALILYFIDNQIVPRILQSNKTAAETFRSWQIELE